jgi:hypothetical protein
MASRAIHSAMQLDEISAGLQILDAALESSQTPLPA